MIIYSFDCAVRKLGFCCISINTNWRIEMGEHIDRLNEFYANTTMSKEETMSEIHTILTQINELLNSMLKIVYVNVFDLLPGEVINAKTRPKYVQSLKYLLKSLKHQLPAPDVVLIENQMKKNGKSNGIAHDLEMYYMPVGVDATLTYTLTEYPIIESKIKEKTKPAVYMLGCSLKNSYDIDKINGKFNIFAQRYNDNYTINKEHCNYNFKYFCKTYNIKLNTKESTRDMADAFMQAYAWAHREKLI
jgi:hypothetical protein